MRGSFKFHALLPILLLGQFLMAHTNLDSIQRLVDSDIPSQKYSGYIGLAEHHLHKNDSLCKFILTKIELEEAGLVDSLYRSLNARRADLYAKLNEHQTGLNLLHKALSYSADRKDVLSIAKWNELMSVHFFYLSEFDSCHKALERGIALYESLGLEEEKANLILKSATVDYAIGNYERAITRAFEATEIFKKGNKEKQLGVAYLQLGNIHYFLKSFDEAQTYYDLSAIYFKKTKDDLGYQKAVSNLGLIHIEKGNFNKGISLQHIALRYFIRENRFIEEGNSYYYLGKAHNGLHNYDSSDYYLNKSIESNKTSNYEIGIAFAYWLKADNQLGRNKIDSAYYFNEQGLQIVEGVTNFEIEKKLYGQKAEILEKQGQFQEALHSLRKHLSLTDSLDIDYAMLDRLASKQRALLETKEYELKLARQEGLEQANENKRQQQLIIAISIIAFLLVFFVIGLVLTNRRNKSLHQQLLENKDTIEQELDTNKALLKEIHHRVKNNLQIISSMLSIQAQYINDEHLDEIINECRSRIISMSLIHESLYKKEENDQSLFSNYIKQLLPTLIDTYHIDKSKIELNMTIDDFELSLDDSVPCGLMINEIVSNALKHGFPDGRNGKIDLSMRKVGKEVILNISDNGVGLPSNFNPEQQDSFGYLLIYTLGHQLEAKIKINNHEGVAFDIRWYTKDDKLLS